MLLRGPLEKVFDQSLCRTKEQKTRLQCLAWAMPESVMSTAAKSVFFKEKKRKDLAELAKKSRLKCFFPAKLSSSNVEAVPLTRAPENEGETHGISFEAAFTLSLAGHIDMLFFRCFCLLSLVCASYSVECCFLPSHSWRPNSDSAPGKLWPLCPPSLHPCAPAPGLPIKAETH